MWEAIASNRRRSRFIILLLGLILIFLGYIIGTLADPENGGIIGAGAALILWFFLSMVALFQGDNVLLHSIHAREIEKQDAPQLWNIVEEMTIASGLGKMPRVYIIDDDSPNAFAVGRKPETAAVAVTSGLLFRLNRDELQGVIAHEIGHIRNEDVRFMTIATVMLGTIVILSEIILRSMWYGGVGRHSGRSRSRSGGKGQGQAQMVMIIVAISAAILAPVFARILYFACSRKREYLADASAARFTRYPEGLASALEKISRRGGSMKEVSRAVAPLFIVNPLQHPSASSLFSTHPPLDKRIAVLRAMGGNVGFREYQAAYRKVEGRTGPLGARTLRDADSTEKRAKSPEEELQEDFVVAHEASDLLGRMGGYLVLRCACDLGLRIPPNYPKDSIRCPRCGRDHTVPAAAPQRQAEAVDVSARNLEYQRKTNGWESFKCSCGHTVQLSPAFAAQFTNCSKCGARIRIQ